jgi:hypothetical protein
METPKTSPKFTVELEELFVTATVRETRDKSVKVALAKVVLGSFVIDSLFSTDCNATELYFRLVVIEFLEYYLKFWYPRILANSVRNLGRILIADPT